MNMKLEFPYLSAEKNRHGNPRLFVRRNGKRIQIKERTGTPEFLRAYQAAMARLERPTKALAPADTTWPRGSLGDLATKYFASMEFMNLDAVSQRTRRQVIESCLREPFSDDDPDQMGNCPLQFVTAKKIKRLRDLKGDKHGAANNRRKYLSAMYGWAIEADLVAANPVRDVRARKYATSGFYTWTVQDVQAFQNRHPIGSKPFLALALLLYLGGRRSDTVKFGEHLVTGEVLKFVPRKTRHKRLTVSEKPILPGLRRIIDQSPVGTQAWLENGHGKPFSAAGFGNWFRERCDEAGLAKCSAHGLRKAGATIAAENGATVHQLMAIYDWTTIKQAEPYTRAASRKLLTQNAMHLIAPGMH